MSSWKTAWSSSTTSAPATSYQDQSVIHGDRIVWADTRNGYYDIYLHDLATGGETRLTTDSRSQDAPAVYGDWVVWEDARHYQSGATVTGFELFGYDLSSSREEQLTTITEFSHLTNGQMFPAISQDKIADLNMGTAAMEVYLHDLGTGQDFQLTPEDGVDRSGHAIHQDQVVWLAYRNGYWRDVFVTRIWYCPTLEAASPSAVRPGENLTLTGRGFGYVQRDSTVTLNGVSCPVVSWSDAAVVCSITAGAVSGAVRLRTRGGESNGVTVIVTVGTDEDQDGSIKKGKSFEPAHAATCLERGLALNPADDIAHEGLGLLPERQGHGAEEAREAGVAMLVSRGAVELRGDMVALKR